MILDPLISLFDYCKRHVCLYSVAILYFIDCGFFSFCRSWKKQP